MHRTNRSESVSDDARNVRILRSAIWPTSHDPTRPVSSRLTATKRMDEMTRNSCVNKGMAIQDLCYQRVVFWLCEKRRRSDELMTQPLFLMRSGCVKKGVAILEYGGLLMSLTVAALSE